MNQHWQYWLTIWDWLKTGLFILSFAALPILLKYGVPQNSKLLTGKLTLSDYDLFHEDLSVVLPLVHQKDPQKQIQEMISLLEDRKPASKSAISKNKYLNKVAGEQAELAGKNVNIEIDSQSRPLEVEAIRDSVN